MAKVNRGDVVAVALDLLDEVGLDAISTRRLAQRLGVEQPALYWHFRDKAALLKEMARAAMAPHAARPLPASAEDWRGWFLENMRSFRRALLSRRDGARLHAGMRPEGGDLDRLTNKVAFLVAAGFDEDDAAMALLVAGRFTVGSALEEEARAAMPSFQADCLSSVGQLTVPEVRDDLTAFEFGLELLTNGLALRWKRLRAIQF